MNPPSLFKEPLLRGVIIERINRFVMNIRIGGEIYHGHCPSTGAIGTIRLEQVPCLLSPSSNPNRKTTHTVEAIEWPHSGHWLNINQGRTNAYVEYFLRNGQLRDLVAGDLLVCEKEKKLGESRLDFLTKTTDDVDTYLEIKTPLDSIGRPQGEMGTPPKGNVYFERLIRHYKTLGAAAASGKRAVVALCYSFDAEPFVAPKRQPWNEGIHRAAQEAHQKGVQLWQINFSLTATGVQLIRYFQIPPARNASLLESHGHPSQAFLRIK